MPPVDDDLPSGLTPEEFSARIFGAHEHGPDAGLELAPFRGVRFAPEVVGDLAAVTTPPYDLIDEDEVRRLLDSDARNIVRLILPRDGDGDPDARYRGAGELLRRWLADGTLVTDPERALYVYEERDEVSLQRGLVGAVGLRPESARVVLPHEDVFPGPVGDRLRLMTATRANLEPIFLVYEGGGKAGALVDEIAVSAKPDVEVTADDGLTHRLWRVVDPAVHAEIAKDLRDRQALIADGHHRYATYRALQARHRAAGDGSGPWDHGLALLVDSTRYPPRLGAIHRVLPGLSPAVAVDLAGKAFRVTELGDSLPAALRSLGEAEGPAFLLSGGKGFHLLTDPDPDQLGRAMPHGHSERWRRLDTAVLDRLLIDRIWGIAEDEHTVEVVHHDAAAAIDRARRAGGTAAILNALQVQDVLALAAGGERVPRKSTSFGPKPRTGLILRLLDGD
ncbi:MAG: hypothetical protein JWO67_1414 [Streptosporangiaceae bacterium]|nr:hypothetical protein [Streptosporangiaceae bacterium]